MIAFVDDFAFNYLLNYFVFVLAAAVPLTLALKCAGPLLLRGTCRLALVVLSRDCPLASRNASEETRRSQPATLEVTFSVLRDRLAEPTGRSTPRERFACLKTWALLDRHRLVESCGKEGFEMIAFERFALVLQAVGLLFCAAAVLVNRFVGEDRHFSLSGTTMGNLASRRGNPRVLSTKYNAIFLEFQIEESVRHRPRRVGRRHDSGDRPVCPPLFPVHLGRKSARQSQKNCVLVQLKSLHEKRRYASATAATPRSVSPPTPRLSFCPS
jgi:hypothetical protein